MTDFYLVTGFLGSGKTTFIKNFIRLFKGKKLFLIINEFGREGVDGRLLKEMGVLLDEICGGSIFCSCRSDMFESALKRGLDESPDAIIVEASGLSDPTSIRTVLEDYERSGTVRYRGCVCIADAVRLKKAASTARTCEKQLAAADVFLLNKTDTASAQEIEASKDVIMKYNSRGSIHETSFGKVRKEWIEDIVPENGGAAEVSTAPDLTLQRAMVTIDSSMTRGELISFMEQFAGETNRIKGFVNLAGKWALVDCVGTHLEVFDWNGDALEKSGLNVLASGKMAMRKKLREAVKLCGGKAAVKFG